MKRMRVEKMPVADAPQMARWMAQLSARNNIDADIFSYPTLSILKASNGRCISYVPFQTTWFLESLALNPEATAPEKAAALRDTFTVIEFEARSQGIREIYFLCADKETKQFCIHHEFDLMTPEIKLATTYQVDGYPDVTNPTMQLFRRKL